MQNSPIQIKTSPSSAPPIWSIITCEVIKMVLLLQRKCTRKKRQRWSLDQEEWLILQSGRGQKVSESSGQVNTWIPNRPIRSNRVLLWHGQGCLWCCRELLRYGALKELSLHPMLYPAHIFSTRIYITDSEAQAPNALILHPRRARPYSYRVRDGPVPVGVSHRRRRRRRRRWRRRMWKRWRRWLRRLRRMLAEVTVNRGRERRPWGRRWRRRVSIGVSGRGRRTRVGTDGWNEDRAEREN